MADNIVPQYFRVTIAGSTLTAAAPADGFVDNVLIEEYGRANASNYPSNLANARAKARGNFRYRRILEELNAMQTVSLVLDVANGITTANATPTAISFTVVFDRAGYVLTRNELFPDSGTELLTGVDAVKRVVARVFLNSYTTKAEFPRDPASAALGYGWLREDLAVNTNLTGTLAQKITAAQNAITVTQINNTL